MRLSIHVVYKIYTAILRIMRYYIDNIIKLYTAFLQFLLYVQWRVLPIPILYVSTLHFNKLTIDESIIFFHSPCVINNVAILLVREF